MSRDLVPSKPPLPDKVERLEIDNKFESNLVQRWGLTVGQYHFVQNYCATFKAKDSYLEAFNCSPSTASTHANRLLKTPKIAGAVGEVLSHYGEAINLQKDALVTMALGTFQDETAKISEKQKAIELIAKLTGSFMDDGKAKKGAQTPIVNISIAGPGEVDVSDDKSSVKPQSGPTVEVEINDNDTPD